MNENTIFPKEVILEVTNRCNLSCRHCHFHADKSLQKRPLGFMEPEIWKKVLNELELNNKPVMLLTHGAGEPLLYPQLRELLYQARKNPNIKLGFMTNGMLLDKKWAHQIVDLQLNYLAISIDGVKPETHDYYRRNAKLKTIEKNIDYLISLKQKKNSSLPVLSFNMVAYPEILDQEISFVERWIEYAGSANISKFRPVGDRKLFSCNNKIEFKACALLWNQLVIGFDGNVGLCCEDINLSVPLANIKDSSITEIYNENEILNFYRKMHLDGKTEGLELCNDCDIWAGDKKTDAGEMVLNGINIYWRKTPAFTNYIRK